MPGSRTRTAGPGRATFAAWDITTFFNRVKFAHLILFLSVLLQGEFLAARGQVPTILNYQGRLSADQVVFNGVGQFKFALINSDGSQSFWMNSADVNSDGEPDAAVLAPISRGLYSILLGDTNVAEMAELPVNVFTNSAVYLRVWFTDGASAFERLGPDQRLAAVGFAIMAATVPERSITASKLAPGALVASNLVGTISTSQVPNLDASKITSGSLDPARVPALDAAQIGSGVFRTERIPGLDAGKIVSGTIEAGRLPSLDASMIGSGTLDAARLPGLDGSRVTSGTIHPARLPGLDASQIASGRFDASFLPSNVAYTDTDLAATRNELSAQIAELSQRVDTMSSGGGGPVPAGAAAVSAEASDPALLNAGFSVFMNVPAPGWTTSAAENALSARYEHAAVWAPNRSEIFVWGGQLGANTYSGAGALYRPGTDQWQTVTTAGAPSARRGHTMVFDGVDGALVWGGFGDSGFLNTGARFDLESGSWSGISAANAPAARDGHVAAWESPVMVIWGGRNSAGALGDGSAYNSVTDQWSAVPAAGGPSPRSGASGVWTGTRLLVWGGVGSAGEVNTGGQLLFQLVPAVAAVQWLPITTIDAPSARTGHAAVWTGTRMIIWGGRNGGTYLRDGAMFDPGTGRWTALAATGAPVGRADAAAVWNGQEMLVFGGETASGPTATGAAYNPATNRWRPLNGSGNPVARAGASSIWTGSELMVFGGRAGELPVAALQRLTPQPTWYFYRKL